MYLVSIEFRRIQTFLFSSRRMRDMVGANVLLGEVIRRELPRLVAEEKKQHGTVPDLSGFAEVPTADAKDPIGSGLDAEDIDDPRALYERGILSREGGHFRVVFEEPEAAERFRVAAEREIVEKLPGLLFDIDIHDLSQLPHPRTRPPRAPREITPVDAPVFMNCQASGTGPAATVEKFRDEKGRITDEEAISEGIAQRRRAYDRFHDGKPTHDVIGLLASRSTKKSKPPEDFEKLCGKDYLAVISADGNDIGKRAMEIADRIEASDVRSFIAREASLEHFFHANRVHFRRAVRTAIDDVFLTAEQPNHQLLMLGGDDLLVACQAKLAFRFATALAEALAGQKGAPTVGIGVAIASRTVPFHHLHQVAEELAKSAKRLYRRLDDDCGPASVIDWHIETGSWALDPMRARRADLIRVAETEGGCETFVLSRRPLRVLSDTPEGEADHRSLAGMMRAADAIERLVAADDAGTKIARSQLRALVQSLERGKRWSEFAFAATPESLRQALDTSPIGLKNIWEGGDGRWTTALRDIVDLFELTRLGAGQRAGEDQS